MFGWFAAQMFLLFNKSQPASEHRIGFIYTEASKNNSADPASALRLRKLLKRVKRKDFGGGKKKKERRRAGTFTVNSASVL